MAGYHSERERHDARRSSSAASGCAESRPIAAAAAASSHLAPPSLDPSLDPFLDRRQSSFSCVFPTSRATSDTNERQISMDWMAFDMLGSGL